MAHWKDAALKAAQAVDALGLREGAALRYVRTTEGSRTALMNAERACDGVKAAVAYARRTTTLDRPTLEHLATLAHNASEALGDLCEALEEAEATPALAGA